MLTIVDYSPSLGQKTENYDVRITTKINDNLETNEGPAIGHYSVLIYISIITALRPCLVWWRERDASTPLSKQNGIHGARAMSTNGKPARSSKRKDWQDSSYTKTVTSIVKTFLLADTIIHFTNTEKDKDDPKFTREQEAHIIKNARDNSIPFKDTEITNTWG